jgi:hypothetical protein
MNFQDLISKLVNNINDNKVDEAISETYNNINIIKEAAKNYCFNIRDFGNNVINYGNDPNMKIEDIKLNSEPINLLNAYRLCIIKLLNTKKHSTKSEAEEMKSIRTKIIYPILIADDEVKTKLFMLYLIVYYIESCARKYHIKEINPNTLNSKPHVGIDYEFNNRLIALMQINFETFATSEYETNSYIWLVNPGEFDEEQNKILIKYLMTNQDIYKILHGPDSLDIPYMYDIMFKGNKDVILEFTKKIFDTRFLCEYVRLSLGLDRKCSIYDALLYF